MDQHNRGEVPEPGTQARAKILNMELAMRTLIECVQAPGDLPSMGLFYGPSGYGKSVACAFAAASTGASYVEAKSVWTLKTLLQNIAHSLGIIRVENTSPKILDQVIEQLRREPRPLIIDEMDYLVKRQMVEIIRDIHDATHIAILMIGEEELPAKLKEWQRFDNRLLVSTPAQPASEADTMLLRDAFCQQVAVADDLALRVCQVCRGVTRRITTNLQRMQMTALEEGEVMIDLKWWGNRPIVNGDLPVRRAVIWA